MPAFRRDALAAFLLAGSLAAQQPARQPAIGEVRDRDGKPFAGATVHLLHRAHPGVLDAAFGDHVAVPVDARGRFRTDVYAGVPYRVWAVADAEGPTYRCTHAPEVVSGVPAVLEEQALHWRRAVRVTVDPSWTQPLAFSVHASLGDLLLREELLARDGVFTTPAWPVDRLQVVVSCGLQRVHGWELATTLAGAQALGATERTLDEPPPGPAADGAEPTPPADDAAVTAALTATAALSLPPRVVTVLPVADAQGKPMPAVPILVDAEPFVELLGNTDAEGRIELPSAHEKGADGRWIAWSSAHAEFPLGRNQVPAEGRTVTAPDLAAGTTVRGRVLLRDGTPLAATPLILDVSIRNADNGWWWGVHPRLLRTDAAGAFAIPGRHASFPFRLSVLLTAAQAAAFAGDGKVPVWPVALLAAETTDPTADPGDLRVDQLVPLDVALSGPDGTPTGSVPVALFPVVDSDARHPPVRALHVRTDRLGRVRVLVPRAPEIAVFAATGAGAAFGVLRGGSGPFTARLDPSLVVAVRAVDGDGRPLAGISVAVSQIELRGAEGDAARVGNCFDGFLTRTFPLLAGTTDADGRVALVAPLPRVKLRAYLSEAPQRNMALVIDLAEPVANPIEVVFAPTKR